MSFARETAKGTAATGPRAARDPGFRGHVEEKAAGRGENVCGFCQEETLLAKP